MFILSILNWYDQLANTNWDRLDDERANKLETALWLDIHDVATDRLAYNDCIDPARLHARHLLAKSDQHVHPHYAIETRGLFLRYSRIDSK